MRNKVIGLILLMVALSLLTLGIVAEQFDLIAIFYEKMAAFE